MDCPLTPALRARLEALPPAAAPNSSTSYASQDCERADRIGEFWGHRSPHLQRAPDQPGRRQGGGVRGLLTEMERK